MESRHKIVDDFFVSALLSFKSESIDLAEACHAAAWKGNMWRITSTEPAIVDWNIFQSRFIGIGSDFCLDSDFCCLLARGFCTTGQKPQAGA